MLKKLLLLICCYTSIFAEIPTQLFVSERLETLMTYFDIETKDQRLGSIYRKVFSLTPEYQLKNLDGETLVKAKMRFWSNGVIFDVKDTKGNALGTIEERVGFYPYLEVVSPKGQKFAKGEFNFWKTTFLLSDPKDNHELVLFTRPFFSFKKEWTVEVKDMSAFKEDKIHPDLFLTLVGLQIDYPYWTYSSSSRSYSVEEKTFSCIKNLKDELQKYEAVLSVKATSNDYQFAFDLGNQWADEDHFYDQAMDLIHQLSSDTLTPPQKKALYKLLESHLNSLK